MIIRKSSYFDRFCCIASACPDSCCKEWQVELDDATAQKYLNLNGDLGQRLRKAMQRFEGTWVFENVNGRCPMWRDDGLCRIQAELNESALCNTCKQFPRLIHDYGDFKEYTLELSCPEAARLIVGYDSAPMTEEICLDVGTADYDAVDMKMLLQSRNKMFSILADRTHNAGEVLAAAFLYGCAVQVELDGGKKADLDIENAVNCARKQAKQGNAQEFISFFKGLEILTPEWKNRLEKIYDLPYTAEHLRIARYFVERYYLQAISDFDLYARVKLMIISCIVIKMLGQGVVQTAQLYSKEIENNAENIEAILNAAYTHSAFADDKLLGWLV